jgi:hypothetical protein
VNAPAEQKLPDRSTLYEDATLAITNLSKIKPPLKGETQNITAHRFPSKGS